jgi:hypothetical protein
LAEAHVVGALRGKRAELAGVVQQLEQELLERRNSLVHLDATMRLFDPDIRPEAIRPRRRRNHNAWFRPNECRRLLYDVLRDAPTPPSTRELTEQLIALKAIPATDDRQRSLVQKTILGSLNAAKDTIERVEQAGVVRWRLR